MYSTAEQKSCMINSFCFSKSSLWRFLFFLQRMWQMIRDQEETHKTQGLSYSQCLVCRWCHRPVFSKRWGWNISETGRSIWTVSAPFVIQKPIFVPFFFDKNDLELQKVTLHFKYLLKIMKKRQTTKQLLFSVRF